MNQKSKWRKLCSLLLAAAMLAGCGNTEEKTVSEVSEAEETNTAESSEDTEVSIGMPKQMPAFIAKDLQGKEISESIFAGEGGAGSAFGCGGLLSGAICSDGNCVLFFQKRKIHQKTVVHGAKRGADVRGREVPALGDGV